MIAFGLAEVDDEIRPGAVFLGACTPFAAGNEEETRLLYESDSSADGGGGGDRLGWLPLVENFLHFLV